jgi:hypothetical protein
MVPLRPENARGTVPAVVPKGLLTGAWVIALRMTASQFSNGTDDLMPVNAPPRDFEKSLACDIEHLCGRLPKKPAFPIFCLTIKF